MSTHKDQEIGNAYIDLKLDLARNVRVSEIEFIMEKFKFKENRKASVRAAVPGVRGLKLLNELGSLGMINKRNIEDLMVLLNDCWDNQDEMEKKIWNFALLRDGRLQREEESRKETQKPAPSVSDMKHNETTTECIICMDTEREAVLIPCGHYCCCMACATTLSKCPVCRRHIEKIQRTYTS